MSEDEIVRFLSVDYNRLDKKTLVEIYEGFFVKKLKKNCELCYQRAYKELTTHFKIDILEVMAKNKKNTDIIEGETIIVPSETPKYTIHPDHIGSTISIKSMGWIITDSVTDEQGDYIIANRPSLAPILVINE